MNADQKQRANGLLSAWRATAYALHGDRMAALLQELVDAPEPEPVAATTLIQTAPKAIYLNISEDGDGSEPLPKGLHSDDIGWSEDPAIAETVKYIRADLAAPTAPSVPDGWRIVPYTPTVQMLERAAYAVNNRPQPSKYEPSATPAIIFWTAMLNYAPEAVFINSCSKPPKLSDERISEIWVEHGLDDEDVEGFARAIEREILGGGE